MKLKKNKFISLSLNYLEKMQYGGIALMAISIFFLIWMGFDIVKELSYKFESLNISSSEPKTSNFVASIGPAQVLINCGFEQDFCVFANAIDDNFDWMINSWSTATSHTWPVWAFTGSNYLYIDSSYPNSPEKIAILESELINASYLEMWIAYHMYWMEVWELIIQVSNNWWSWETVFSDEWNKWAQWNYEKIDLTSYTWKIKIRIKAITSDDLYQWYKWDIAIDEILIKTSIALKPFDDSDRDGVQNSHDLWPYDPNDWWEILNPNSDFDEDGILNDVDNDIDGDWVDNVSDLWPYDPWVTKWKLDISSDTYLKTLYWENATDAQGSDIININNIEVDWNIRAESISVNQDVLIKKSYWSMLLPKLSAWKYKINDLAEKFKFLDNFSIQYFNKENRSSWECSRKNWELIGCSDLLVDKNINDKIFVKVSDDISINLQLDPVLSWWWMPANFIASSPSENLNLLWWAWNTDVVVQWGKLKLASVDSTFCIDSDCINREDFAKIAWIWSSEYLRQKPSLIKMWSEIVKDIKSWLLWYNQNLWQWSYEDLINKCKNLDIWWYKWHLPDSDELMSVFNYNKIVVNGDSAYDTNMFDKWPLSWSMRTSTEDAQFDSMAISFLVNWETFKVGKSEITNQYWICVSSDKSLKNIPQNWKRFNLNDSWNNCELKDTLRFKEKSWQIKDLCTGLIWEKSSNYWYLNWADAKLYCEDLVLWWYWSWRLPNVKELYSIINKWKTKEQWNEYRPFFDEIKWLWKFWTWTKSPNYINSHHWQILLSWAEVVANPDDYSDHHVRCVR